MESEKNYFKGKLFKKYILRFISDALAVSFFNFFFTVNPTPKMYRNLQNEITFAKPCELLRIFVWVRNFEMCTNSQPIH